MSVQEMEDQADAQTPPRRAGVPATTWVAVVSAIIACIAASATTFQSYLAYSVRNHPLRAQLTAQFAQKCAEGVLTVNDFDVSLRRYKLRLEASKAIPEERVLEIYNLSLKVMENSRVLLLLLEAMEPDKSEDFANEFIKLADQILDAIDAFSNDSVTTEAATKYQVSAKNYSKALDRQCTTVMRQALSG
jgi:propanediol dehydratase small subunit